MTSITANANGFTLMITADLDETDTGGQAVAGGRFSIGAPLDQSPIISGVLDLPDLLPNSPTDSVQVTIDASAITTGTYPLFVYGIDELGNEGPPTAVWVTLPGNTESLIYLPFVDQ